MSAARPLRRPGDRQASTGTENVAIRSSPTIDAHLHLWRYDVRPHSWPDDARRHLDRDFTADMAQAEMAAARVDGTVLMQSLNDLRETEELLELAEATGWVRGVVGWLPLSRPDEVASILGGIEDRSKLVGMRHLINFEADPNWLLGSRVQGSIGLVAERGLVFDTVPIDATRFGAVLATAERHPALRIVIDHLGRPPVESGGWEPWATLMARAGELPNVSVKLSVGLDVVLGWTWSVQALRRYSDHVIEHLGPRRVMAASNWPVTILAGSYGDTWSALRTLVAELEPDDQASVLGGTAHSVFALGRHTAQPRGPAKTAG